MDQSSVRAVRARSRGDEIGLGGEQLNGARLCLEGLERPWMQGR